MQWSGLSLFFLFVSFWCRGVHAPTARRGDKCSPPKQGICLWPEWDFENTISAVKIVKHLI